MPPGRHHHCENERPPAREVGQVTPQRHLDHPLCDLARHHMTLAFASTGVTLSDRIHRMLFTDEVESVEAPPA